MRTAARRGDQPPRHDIEVIPLAFLDARNDSQGFAPHGWIHDGDPFDAYGESRVIDNALTTSGRGLPAALALHTSEAPTA